MKDFKVGIRKLSPATNIALSIRFQKGGATRKGFLAATLFGVECAIQLAVAIDFAPSRRTNFLPLNWDEVGDLVAKKRQVNEVFVKELGWNPRAWSDIFLFCSEEVFLQKFWRNK